MDLSVSSSSWGLERAAVCDCGTPWTFLLPFLYFCFQYNSAYLCFEVFVSNIIVLIVIYSFVSNMCIIVSHKPFKGEYQMCFSALSYSVYVYQISLYFICDNLINHYLLTLPAYFLTYLLTYLLTKHTHTPREREREREYPASILYKSIAGRYQPVSYPDGPMTARYRFIKNAYRVYTLTISVKIQLNTSIRAI